VNGRVDEFGRALLGVSIRAAGHEDPVEVAMWVDTAFNGEVVVPRAMIESLGLEQSGGIRARLADGNEVTLETYACVLDWFGDQRSVEVIANNGQVPLLGIGLLIGHCLVIDYTNLIVSLE
jgi:clan AA aspartic protease